MDGVSAVSVALGIAVSVVVSVFSAIGDRSLASYTFWRHYAPKRAVGVRNWTIAVHALAGLAGGLALALVTHWFPLGKGTVAVALAGVAWAGLSEALLRAEVFVVDMSVAKPGMSLLRKLLAARYSELEKDLDREINARILNRTATTAELIDLLSECLGLAHLTGLAATAAGVVTESMAKRLGGSVSEQAGARAEALAAIRREVHAQQRLL